MTPNNILIVEDEHALGTALSFAVRRAGHVPTLVASGAAALDALKRESFAAVVLDIGLPDISGLRVLEKLRAKDQSLPVLIITAHATLDHAISAQKLGATEYLPKPLDLRQFERTLAGLLAQGIPLEAPTSPAMPGVTLIGAAACLQDVFIGIARACAGDVPCLITGPSGSGKSLAASVIHSHGTRVKQPIAQADASVLKDSTALDSLLTNHSQTTLVLKEITQLSSELQAQLAAWLAAPPKQHARLIATTSADPRAACESGTLRAELYYALAALTIPMPPLRERTGDIPALSAYFLGLRGGASLQLTPMALAALQGYAWPGNVRELRHVLDYAASVCRSGSILVNHLPPHIASAASDSPALPPSGELDVTLARWLEQQLSVPGEVPSYDTLLDRIEAITLSHLLTRYDQKPTHLANELRMNRATLRQKLRRAGLRNDEV